MVTPVSSVSGWPKILLRMEGFAVLILSVGAYAHLSGDWGQFALLFLLPDISFLAYLRGPRIGAMAYNLAHSHVLPSIFVMLSYVFERPEAIPLLLIWFAHIGFDRAAGYGLKYATAFGHTHLGLIGRWKASA